MIWSQTTGYGLERTLSQWYKKEEPSCCRVDCLSQESKNPARPKQLQFSGQSPGKESVARIYHSGDVQRAPGSSVKDWSAHSCEKLLKDEKDQPKRFRGNISSAHTGATNIVSPESLEVGVVQGTQTCLVSVLEKYEFHSEESHFYLTHF